MTKIQLPVFFPEPLPEKFIIEGEKIMRKIIISMIVFIITAFPVIGEESKFMAGAAKRVITPDKLLPISGGVGVPKPATQKKGDLFARVMVLQDGDTRVAIVGIDNLGWPSILANKVRKLVPAIPPGNILIGVTHTHSAPDAYGFTDEEGNSYADFEYLEWCVEQTAETINEAVDDLQPAELKIAVGEAKGKIAYNYYAEKLYDPRCGVIQAVATTGKNMGNIIVTMVNYATHPEILGPKRGIISPDMCGPLYDRIESKVGGVAVFMNSAQGGMVTADNRGEGGKETATWEECIRNGNLLADEALRIINGAEPQKNPGLYCTAEFVKLPIESELMRYVFDHSPYKVEIGDDYIVTTQVNLLNIGTAQVLTIPGEALPNIGFYLKRKMNTKQPFLFGLTNDAFGYILTKVDYNSFKRYDYISRTSLGEMTGEIYIEEALKLIAKSPKPDGQ